MVSIINGVLGGIVALVTIFICARTLLDGPKRYQRSPSPIGPNSEAHDRPASPVRVSITAIETSSVNIGESSNSRESPSATARSQQQVSLPYTYPPYRSSSIAARPPSQNQHTSSPSTSAPAPSNNASRLEPHTASRKGKERAT